MVVMCSDVASDLCTFAVSFSTIIFHGHVYGHVMVSTIVRSQCVSNNKLHQARHLQCSI